MTEDADVFAIFLVSNVRPQSRQVGHLAVAAHIRHTEVRYDELPAQGWDRHDVRAKVAEQVGSVMAEWETRE